VLLALLTVGGCALGSGIEQASPKLNTEISLLKSIRKHVVGVKTKIENTQKISQAAGRDAVSSINDTWTTRMLAFAVSSYPVGKLLWMLAGLCGTTVGKRARRRGLQAAAGT